MMLPTAVFIHPCRQLSAASEALGFTTSPYRCPPTATVRVPRGGHQNDYLPSSRGPTRPSRPPTSPQRLTPATCQPPRSSGDKHPTSGIFETVHPCTNHNHMSNPGHISRRCGTDAGRSLRPTRDWGALRNDVRYSLMCSAVEQGLWLCDTPRRTPSQPGLCLIGALRIAGVQPR